MSDQATRSIKKLERTILFLLVLPILAGCTQAFITKFSGPLQEPAWRKRSGWSQAGAVLIQIDPIYHNESDISKVSWGLRFYQADSRQLMVSSTLGADERGKNDTKRSLFLIPMPAGAYAATAFFTNAGHDEIVTPITGPSFERFTIHEGEVVVLGSVNADITMRGAGSSLGTARADVVQTLQGHIDPATTKAMLNEALSADLSWPETREGWIDPIKTALDKLEPATKKF